MDYKEKYEQALKRAKDYKNDIIHRELEIGENIMDYIFPELAESEDERIRKDCIKYLDWEYQHCPLNEDKMKIEKCVAWLEKQESVGEIVARCKKSWYNEGKIDGKFEGIADDVKYQQGWHDAIEKQGEPTEINPTEFDTRLQALIGKFDSLPKEELIGSLSFWLNVVHNDGTYKEEKQGEKPLNDTDEEIVEAVKDTSVLDMVEPKFKVGDWVVQGYNILKIKCVGDTHYCFETVGGYVDDMLVSEIDSQFHLWTIEDAKDGDVLASGQVVFIFKVIRDAWLYCHCSVHNDGSFIAESYDMMTYKYFGEVHPATKEQRSLLFLKMKEEGYVWDDENKKLNEIKQEDEEYSGEDYGIDSLYHAISILEKTLGEVEGYQSDDGILEHQCAITEVKKLYNKKPAEWSEEDEENLQGIIDEIEANKSEAPEYDLKTYDRFLFWLRSLKERIK